MYLVMPGVTIGEGVILLTGSVVIKDVEPWNIVGGNPAKKIRELNRDIDYNKFINTGSHYNEHSFFN